MQKRLSLAVLAALAVSGPSFAAEPVQFRFQASQLATEAGAAAVYARMNKEAAEACATANIAARMRGEVAECKTRLLADWVSASGDARLAELHRKSVL